MASKLARHAFGLLLTAGIAFSALALAPSADATFPGRAGPMLITEGRYVVSVDPATGASRRIIEPGNANYGPTITADGRHFVYIGGEIETNTIFIRSLSNTNPGYKGRAILTTGSQSGQAGSLGMRTLDLSPGRGRIVFSAVAGGYGKHSENRIEIYSIKRDGSGLKRLTRNRTFDNDPAVSPDGSKIAFVRRSGGNAHLWIMNSDGTGQRRIGHGKGWQRLPTFSPNGRRILYTGQVPREGLSRWSSAELFTVSSKDGRHRARLTHNRSGERNSAFSPTGRAIAYLAGYYNLKILNFDSGETRLAYRSDYGGGITSLTWGPKP